MEDLILKVQKRAFPSKGGACGFRPSPLRFSESENRVKGAKLDIMLKRIDD